MYPILKCLLVWYITPLKFQIKIKKLLLKVIFRSVSKLKKNSLQNAFVWYTYQLYTNCDY